MEKQFEQKLKIYWKLNTTSCSTMFLFKNNNIFTLSGATCGGGSVVV